MPSNSTNDSNGGRWHLVEYLQGPKTPGVANGTLDVWVDGRPDERWTDAQFFAAEHTPSLDRLEINPIFGGGSHPVTRNQWLRLGPMLIRTR